VQLEPVSQFFPELGFVQLYRVLEFLGDIAYVIQQALVIRAMLRVMIVVIPQHHLLLEREMGRNVTVNFAEAIDDQFLVALVLDQLVDVIDLANQLLMLEINLPAIRSKSSTSVLFGGAIRLTQIRQKSYAPRYHDHPSFKLIKVKPARPLADTVRVDSLNNFSI
jgi:hypothetical protein